jgi:hypothetical protein
MIDKDSTIQCTVPASGITTRTAFHMFLIIALRGTANLRVEGTPPMS